jgi:hypothetical protein
MFKQSGAFWALSTLIMSLAANGAMAGVGFDFASGPAQGAGSPYNFAVSTASPGSLGQLTADEFVGDEGVPGGSQRRTFDILSLFQRSGLDNGISRFGGMGSGGGGGPVRRSLGALPNSNHLGQGGSGGAARGVVDPTDPTTPINSNNDCGPDNSTDNGSGDPNGGQSGSGGVNPSVVPEPGMFALWVLAGVLLVSTTRRG